MNKQGRALVILVMVTLLAAGPKVARQQTYAFSADLAATITVTTTDDELNSDGDCSLREAIQAANQNKVVDKCAAGGGNDEISLPAGTYTLTLSGDEEDNNASGDLDIQSNLTINGEEAIRTIIDGNALDSVLHIPSPQAQVVVHQVTIANGLAESGGGILNNGILTLTHSIVSDNKVDYYGGGIFNLGALGVVNSIVRNNHSVNFNGEGGGIRNDGSLTMTNSNISGNTALRYAGSFANFGTATLTAVIISGNSAAEQGGGIINYGGSELVITNSILHDNRASYGAAISTSGPLTLTNSTISGNHATYGGGIYLQLNTVRLINSTISANHAIGAAGILSGYEGTIILANSIIANQIKGGDCLNPDGVITSAGYNLDSDNSCNLVATSDIPAGSANLGPLQDNGGATWTHALLLGSAAIDHGDCHGGTTTTDQRGVVRPQGLQCDSGSFETTGAAIAFSKTPKTQTIASGETASFTMTITNTGSITLTNITLVDQLVPACDRVVGTLSPLAATSYRCNLPSIIVVFTNKAMVTASTGAGDFVQDEDAAAVKLIGWSDIFLPLVITGEQTLQKR